MQQSLTLPSRTRCHTSQNLAKSVPALTQDKFNFFLPSLRCFNFFATHSRHKNSWTEIAKTHTGQGFTMTVDRRAACNTGLAKVAAQCSAVRQMADEKNTYLRQAPNLYVL